MPLFALFLLVFDEKIGVFIAFALRIRYKSRAKTTGYSAVETPDHAEYL
jgi:hypothetical protein